VEYIIFAILKGETKLLDSLITSKTRIKLLLKFFFNPDNKSYLRELAQEFNESTNSVRIELNRLTDAGLLESKNQGRTVLYQANKNHNLFIDIHNIVKKFVGIDRIIENVIDKLGNVELALVTGDYAKGIDSGIIDLIIIGDIDKQYLNQLVEKSEELIQRKIRALVLSQTEFNKLKSKLLDNPALIVWENTNSISVSN
jgi:DNA-binding transcriptional ArsR family regulator